MPEMAVTPKSAALTVAPASAASATSEAEVSEPGATQGTAGFAALLKQRLAGGVAKEAGNGASGIPEPGDLFQAPAGDAMALAGQDAVAALLPALQTLLAHASREADAPPATTEASAAVPGDTLHMADGAMVQATAGPDGMAIPTEATEPETVAAENAKDQPVAFRRAAPDMQAKADAATHAAAEPPAIDKTAAPPANFAAQLAAAAETAGARTTADAASPIAEPAASSTPVSPQVAHAASPTPVESRAPLRVDTPVGTRGWDQELGQKLVLLVGRDEQRAELTLTPPSLGRVEVTITMSGDQTSALFVSSSAQVRDALQDALPRLRELLAEAGVQLGQADVSAESSRGDDRGEPSARTGARRTAQGGSAEAGNAAMSVRRANGLVDTFV